MRTTVTLDDDLYRKVLEMADPDMNKADLFREAVKTFIRLRRHRCRAAGVRPADTRCAAVDPRQGTPGSSPTIGR
jgi:metal-responsive CopG/Arc/MetJ family transcriptional regulator